MTRYIDADRLKRTFASGIRVYDGMCKIDDVMHNIENEPTADVEEVRHGMWIHLGEVGVAKAVYACSLCDRTECMDIDNLEPYCHCGAKMDGGNELQQS